MKLKMQRAKSNNSGDVTIPPPFSFRRCNEATPSSLSKPLFNLQLHELNLQDDYYFILQSWEALQQNGEAYAGPPWYNINIAPTPSASYLPQICNEDTRWEQPPSLPPPSYLTPRPLFNTWENGGSSNQLPPWFNLDDLQLCVHRALEKIELERRKVAAAESVVSKVFQDMYTKPQGGGKTAGFGRLHKLQAALRKSKLVEYKARDSLQKLNHGETFNEICEGSYHLPSTVELAAARRVSEDVQRTAILRNWHRIRMAFDLSGCLLLPAQVEKVLVKVGLSVKHASRTVSNLLYIYGRDLGLVSYDLFEKAYGDDTCVGYERDETCLEVVCELADPRENMALAYPEYEQFKQRIDQAFAQCWLYQAHLNAATKAYLKLLPSAHTYTSTETLRSSLNKAEYVRMVFALRRRLSCCILLRNLAPYRSGMEVYKTLQRLGTSLYFLGLLQKFWLSEAIPVETVRAILEGTYPKHFVQLTDRLSLALPGYLKYASENKSLMEAVDELRFAAAGMIQTLSRGVLARKFVRKKRLDEIADRLYYKATSSTCNQWFAYAKRRKAYFLTTRRKFYVWRVHTRRIMKRRETFRTCFWPLYVWRREVEFTITARAKAKFLKSVWQTFRKLRVMREWMKFAQSCRSKKEEALKLYLMKSTSTVQVIFHEWRKLAKYESFQRDCWKSKGLPIHERRGRKCLETVFLCWKHLCLGAKRFNRNQEKRLRRDMLAADWSPAEIELEESAIVQSLGDSKRHCIGPLRQVYAELKASNKIDFYRKAVTFKVYLPRCFQGWKSYVELQQKKRYAWHFYTTKLQRHVFDAWAVLDEEAIEAPSASEDEEVTAAKPESEENEKPKLSQRQCDKATREEFQRNKQTQQELLHRAILEAEALRVEAFEVAETAKHVEERMETFSESLLSCDRLATEFLSTKRKQNTAVVEEIRHSAASLKASRAKLLHDAMCKVLDELSEKRVRKYVVLAFRRMRVTVAEKRIRSFRNRNLLKRWMRICIRLKKVSDGMPKYYEARLKWTMFNKWLQFINNNYLYRSPGLVTELNRRQDLLLGFSNGLIEASETGNGEDHFHLSVRGVFQRWVEFTQKRITRKQLVGLSRRRLDLATKRRVFTALERGLRPRYASLAEQRERCYVYKRCAHDLTAWKEQLLAGEQQLYSCKFAHRNKFVWMKTKILTLNSTILKTELERTKEEMEERLNIESRLLYTSFEERGTFRFKDDVQKAFGPAASNTLGAFQDEEVQSFVSIKSVRLYQSDGSISGIRLTYVSNNGFMWNTPCRGGDSKTQFDFELESSEGERLVGIEGSISHTVECMRFHTSKGRTSEWVGQAVYGVRFLIGSTKPGTSREFIIGLHGKVGVNAIGSIGGICRRITDYGVFSNCWQHRPFVEERADRQGNVEAEEVEQIETQQQKQFARVLAMRRSDVIHAAQRSFKLALCMRYDSSTPSALRSVTIAVAISRWYFESVNKKLLRLDVSPNENSSKKGRRRMTHGYISLRNGNMKIQAAQNELREIKTLLHKGNVLFKVRLNEAEIGMTRTAELLRRKAKAEKLLYEGTREASLGASAMEAGRHKLAKLKCDATLQQYFERLVELSIVEDSL